MQILSTLIFIPTLRFWLAKVFITCGLKPFPKARFFLYMTPLTVFAASPAVPSITVQYTRIRIIQHRFAYPHGFALQQQNH
ncbi:hypothetical protein GGR56DRAFT_638174 [Xylariaceae sp. FL0804]|nr:hypothetical protein GGR56DRAFT_638174 [Xylariaceae sp. FL0804]